jgi:glycosyltransferase involved in cell wall biosynthesis
MKVAIVHELLTRRGGAERVAKIFAEMFPEAPVYTLLYDEEKLRAWFPPARVRASRLQRFARFSTNHHLYLSAFPRAVEEWDFSEFDLVLSSSSAFAHGIITNGKPLHLCYVHSPARYLWDATHEVLARVNVLARPYLSRTFHRLRVWDAESADRPDHLLCNSREVQRRIQLYWRRSADIVPPPIEDFWSASAGSAEQTPQRQYFLIVSTLTPYKRIDLAIEACNAEHARLLIVGEGPDRARLERLAGPTVEFLGYRPNEEVRDLYRHALAVVFPGDDDFGLVPLEAQATGTPVLAYRKGGALETMIDGKTGVFFDDPTAASLREGLRRMETAHFSPDDCRAQAQRFSRATFEGRIRASIENLLHARAA